MELNNRWFPDDVKLNEMQTVQMIIWDIVMVFRIEKCGVMILKKRKIIKIHRINLKVGGMLGIIKNI